MPTRYTLAPKFGGGDFVMHKLSCGEYEKVLENVSNKASQVEVTSELVMASISKWRGKPLPVGADREEWWRALPLDVRTLTIAAYNQIHAVSEKDLADFFAAAEAEK